MHCQLMTHLHRNTVHLSWIHAAFADCFNTFNRVKEILMIERQMRLRCILTRFPRKQDRHFMSLLGPEKAQIILFYEISKHFGSNDRKSAYEFKIKCTRVRLSLC